MGPSLYVTGMKISFEKKIVVGFITNLLVVGLLAYIYFVRIRETNDPKTDTIYNWIALFLFTASFVMLTIVFFIFRAQLLAKKISQQQLFENKQLLQSVIDNTTNSISVKRINGEYILVNRQFEELFNITNEEIKTKTDHDFLPKEIADSYRNSDLEVVKLGKEIKVEESIVQSDGHHIYLAVKFPLYDATGRIYAVGTIATDISDSKAEEKSLRAGDKFFNMSLDVLVIASNDFFVKINPTLSRILGYTDKELLSNSYIKYIHPDDIEITQKEIEKLQTGVNTINFENRWICKDGTIKWLSWLASPDLSTGLLYAVAHDITENKLKREELTEVNYFLDTVLDNIPNMIVVKDARDLKYLKFNKAAEKLLGYPSRSVLGKNDYDFFPEKEAVMFMDSDRKIIEKGEYLNIHEEQIDTKFGKKWLHTQKIPILDENGDPLYLISISEDITERRKNEESLKISNMFFDMSFDMLVVAKGEYFIKVNAAFTRILGYNQKDMDDRPFLSFAHPDDAKTAKSILQNLAEGEPVVNFQARAKCKDGSYKTLDWTATSDKDSGLIYAVARDVTELAKNEESLKMIKRFFELSFDILFVLKDKKFITINPAFVKTIGYTQKELDDMTYKDVLKPVDQEIATERIAKMMRGEQTPSIIYNVICKDKSIKLVEIISAGDAEAGMIFSVGRDVTEREKNIESIKIADTFFNMSFDMLAVFQGDFLIKINPAFTSTLGYSQDDMDKIPFLELTEDAKRTKEAIENLKKGQSLVSFKDSIRCKDKSFKWLDWNATIDPETGIMYWCGRDITEKIKLEKEQQETVEELYENEQKLSLIIDNIGEGVIVANADKKILLANYMANELFGVEDDTQISANFSDRFEVYLPDEKTIFPSQNLPMDRALRGEITDDIDVVFWNPTAQEKKRVLLSGRPIIDQNNHVIAAVITIKDISKYKQMEEELKETEMKYRRLIGFKKNEDPIEVKSLETKPTEEKPAEIKPKKVKKDENKKK